VTSTARARSTLPATTSATHSVRSRHRFGVAMSTELLFVEVIDVTWR
jgi:hypothetical protein